MIRPLHAGDLHPNSNATFAGKVAIDPETGMNQSLTDIRRSLEEMRLFATDEETRCDVVLLTGDVFDTCNPTMDEVEVIVSWVEAMAEAMPVVIIPGNHDMGSSGTSATAMAPLKYRKNVHVMERPSRIVLNIGGQRVKFFGLPYPRKGLILAHDNHQGKTSEEVTALINQGLAAIIRSFTLEFEDDIPNILLAHGSVDNAKVGDQPRSLSHDILIPLQECTGFDYVGLGHIHQPQQVAPNAWYSGSLMRQTFGEEHEPKGFNVVEICKCRPVNVQHVVNPWARKYKTLTMQDVRELEWQHVSAEHIYRIKDRLTAEEYDAAKPMIKKWVDEHPWTQIDVEVATTDRTRDAGMAECASMEDSLARALKGTVEESEIPEIFGKHQQLVAEVSR
ncbi:MAG: exonuclease subunit SbcD [Nitrospirota bacterium]|nr:exonuclease subunit SbcD [Nitrospirota bacterium]